MPILPREAPDSEEQLMSHRILQLLMLFVTGFLVILQLGCSGGPGQALGISPPQHRLLPQTKDFRAVSRPPNGPRELNKALLPAHIVEPGDVLLVQPAELDAPVRIAADQPVLPDGTIDLGSYGRPLVAGKTVPVIETEINELVKPKLKAGETATINVRIINRNSKVYYVLGEVNAPGAFPITGRETALDAILAAGGLTRKASEKNIVLSRPSEPCNCRKVYPICYPHIVQLGDTTTNYQIMPGDRIFVPSQTFMDGICPNKKSKGCDPCDGPQSLLPDGPARDVRLSVAE